MCLLFCLCYLLTSSRLAALLGVVLIKGCPVECSVATSLLSPALGLAFGGGADIVTKKGLLFANS